MMLVSDLISETRNLLLTGATEERNKLTTAIDAATTTLTLTYDMGAVDRGARLSIDLEDLYVWAKSSQVATVERGDSGSTPAAHAANATVLVNSKFSPYQILKAVNNELVSLSSPSNGLFAIQDYELTYSPLTAGYDFPYSVIDIHEVRYTYPGPGNDWFVSQDWEYTRNAGTDFTSDKALFIRDAFPNNTVIVKAKVGFTALPASLAADLAASGLPESCYDILAIGAAWRLTSPREVRRNFDEIQGDTRRAQEVPPGANLGGARELGRLRQLRINEEAARLSQQYPSRSNRFPFKVG